MPFGMRVFRVRTIEDVVSKLDLALPSSGSSLAQLGVEAPDRFPLVLDLPSS